MEKDTTKSSYTTTKDNIKYPTYMNDELSNDFKSNVDLVSLGKEFSIFFNTLDQFSHNYYDALKANQHDIFALYKKNKKNAVDYFLLARGLKILCVITQTKMKTQQDYSPIEEKSIEQLINLYNEDNEYGSLLKQNYANEHEVREVLKLFLDYEKQITDATNKSGLVMIETTLKYATCVCKSILKSFKTFTDIKDFYPVTSKKEHKSNDIILFELIIKLDKIPLLSLCLNNCFLIDENDILNKSESSDEWQDLKKIMVRVISSNEEEMKKDIREMKKGFGTMMALITKGFSSHSNFVNFFKVGGTGIHYMTNTDDALYDGMKLLVNPDPNFYALMCDVLQVGFMKQLTVHSFPKIKFRKKLYLKRLFKEIDLDYIGKLNNYVYGKSNDFDSEINEYNKALQNEEIPVNQERKKPFELFVEKINKPDKKYYVSTNLLHNSKIHFPKEKHKLLSKKPKINVTQDTLMIHIHGGGFIATSTLTHENYLREWANHLGIPILGINYSLSPKEQYPKAIDDVWQAYNWIMKHAETKFNIKLRRVIVSGDSAGGTLALALTYLLIVHKARVPDLLILQYPACNTSMTNMNNSMLLCIEDHVLSYGFLTYSSVSYRSNYPNDEDPFLNPVKMPEHLLKSLPRTRFFFGSCDPLRDDSVRLLSKISKTNIDCLAYDFKDNIHGFNALHSVALRDIPQEFIFKEVEQFLKDTNQ